MKLLAEVGDMYHELHASKIEALRAHGPVLCTVGPTGTPAADYAAEAADMGAVALFMGSESDAVSAVDLAPLATTLRALSVGWRLMDPEYLAEFGLLTELRVDRWHHEGVAALGGIESLQWLCLNEAGKVVDLSGLPSSLKYLEMVYPSKVVDLTPLTTLRKLEALVLEPANRLEDLTPLASMPALRHLSVEGKLLRDPSPLAGHPGIEVFMWGGKRVPTMPEVVASMPALRFLLAPTTAGEDRSWRPNDEGALREFHVIRA